MIKEIMQRVKQRRFSNVASISDSREESDRFSGHYRLWQFKRIKAIIAYYGAGWFPGKNILEIGCGYGDIGIALEQLGASVTFSDGRNEHLRVISERYPELPSNRLVCYNAETPWMFNDEYDLVLHLGLLYHLDNWEASLVSTLGQSAAIVLETEVCDSDQDITMKITENGYDQSLCGVASRPSQSAVERVIRASGRDFYCVTDSRCNAGIHVYDWAITNAGYNRHGLRRFWFIR